MKFASEALISKIEGKVSALDTADTKEYISTDIIWLRDWQRIQDLCYLSHYMQREEAKKFDELLDAYNRFSDELRELFYSLFKDETLKTMMIDLQDDMVLCEKLQKEERQKLRNKILKVSVEEAKNSIIENK
jgi:hypothetical protein